MQATTDVNFEEILKFAYTLHLCVASDSPDKKAIPSTYSRRGLALVKCCCLAREFVLQRTPRANRNKSRPTVSDRKLP